MNIPIDCPECSKKITLKLADNFNLASKPKVTCPFCKKQFVCDLSSHGQAGCTGLPTNLIEEPAYITVVRDGNTPEQRLGLVMGSQTVGRKSGTKQSKLSITTTDDRMHGMHFVIHVSANRNGVIDFRLSRGNTGSSSTLRIVDRETEKGISISDTDVVFLSDKSIIQAGNTRMVFRISESALAQNRQSENQIQRNPEATILIKK